VKKPPTIPSTDALDRKSTRLPASERRAAVLDCACRVFSRASYRGATTAEIAREAGVTEPVLYRHFDSKRDLYLACLEECWENVRTMWEQVIADEPDPGNWIPAMGQSFLHSPKYRPLIANLWVQALTEAAEDDEIRRYMKKHIREVHRFAADVIRRSQQTSEGVLPDRDPDAEAWIFLALGLLSMADRQLGGLMTEEWPKIRSSRRRWMTGPADESPAASRPSDRRKSDRLRGHDDFRR
jgi:AcrR family transcriptional regulator